MNKVTQNGKSKNAEGVTHKSAYRLDGWIECHFGAITLGGAGGTIGRTSVSLMMSGDDPTETALLGLGIGAVIGTIASYAIQSRV